MSKTLNPTQLARLERHKNLREKQGNSVLRGFSSVFAVSILAVFPLYVTFSKYMLIVHYKTNFFYVFTAVSALMVISAICYLPRHLKLNNYYGEGMVKRPLSLPEWALLAFLLLVLISAIFSPWQDTVWLGRIGRYQGFWIFLCYGATFFIIARFYRPKRLHLIIIAIGVILMSLYGALQFLGLDFLNLFPYTHATHIDANGVSLYGPITAYYLTTLGNINVVSAVCSLVVVLFTALFTGEKSKWGILYWAASFMSFLLLLIANSDGGKVGILGAMILLIPYWFAGRRRLGKLCLTLSGWCAAYIGYNAYLSAIKVNAANYPVYDYNFLQAFTPPSLIPFVILAAVLLAAGLGLLKVINKWPERLMKTAGVIFLAASFAGGLLAVEVIGSREASRLEEGQSGSIIWEAREILHGNLDDDFGSYRGWAWKRGLSVIPANPLLGTGPGTFYQALGEELHAESRALYNTWFDTAHNLYLEIAVCTGIPALLAFMVFLGGLFVPALKKAFKNPLLFAFGAAALSYLIQCFFEIDIPIDKPLLWASLGVMGGELWRERSGRDVSVL